VDNPFLFDACCTVEGAAEHQQQLDEIEQEV
jgi:hypothetical protein